MKNDEASCPKLGEQHGDLQWRQRQHLALVLNIISIISIIDTKALPSIFLIMEQVKPELSLVIMKPNI